MVKPAERFLRRRERTRAALRKAGQGRPRLSVFRSGKHIYAQVIDDQAGRTLAAASTLDAGLRGQLKTGADQNAAEQVGKLIAERARGAGVEAVVFDRGAYRYHGRVKALAEAARAGGLVF
jgi:large subunit ribosomal protein L18